MNKNGNGIEIYSIDENKQEMIIHLGKIRDFYKEYSQLKNENQELRIQVSSREKVASKYKETIGLMSSFRTLFFTHFIFPYLNLFQFLYL